MPVGINSPARNLFLLGSSGQAAVTNFFQTIDQSAGTDGVYLPSEIKYIFSNQKYALAGTAQDSNSTEFGWFERQDYDLETGSLTTDYTNRVESTQGLATTLTAMELDHTDHLIVVGKTGTVPWIAQYQNNGTINWQATTNSADVEYTGVASAVDTVTNLANYYACGYTSGDAQAFVEKFDVNGNPGWGKSAFMLGRDVTLTSIDANSRREVVAVGSLEDDSFTKGYIVKIDTDTGEVLWDRTLDAGANLVLNDVFIDSNNQIYIVGTSSDQGYIFKYTAEGNLIWQKRTNGTALENFTFDRVKSDGETEQTIVFGTYYDQNGNDRGGVLSKYGKDGNLVWRRTLFSSFNNADSFSNVCLDADPSFYYLMYVDSDIDVLNGTPDAYTFGQVSSSGNGLGGFQYAEGTGETIDYEILNIGDAISRVSDGSVRNDTSDLITYPFTANKIVFDDLSTQVTNKKRQMDDADSFEYSGSPAIRPADFQELNLLGESIVVGPELITNGDFSNGTTGWSNDPTEILTVSGGGVATVDRNGGSSQGQCYQTILTEVGRSYTVSVLVSALSNGFQVYANNGSTAMSQGAVNSTGTHYWTFTATTSATRLDFSAVQNVNGTASFDNISAKEYTWLDRSGKSNDGKVYGGLTANTSTGYWEFDGVDDYISGNSTPLANTTEGTIEAWIKTTSTANPGGHIYGESLPGTSLYWAHFRLNGSVLHFVVDDNDVVAQANGSSTVNDGNWHHVAVTGDGTNWTFYVDGVAEAPTFIVGGGGIGGTKWFNDAPGLTHYSIGSLDRSTRGNFFDGNIGEVRVYPRALTAAQVFQNYNATKSKYIDEAPDVAPKITSDGIVVDNNLVLNYDFGNRATYDRAENLLPWSEDFTKWNQSVHFWENNYAIAPDGSRTAALLKESIPAQQQLSYFNIATMPNVTVASGDTFTFTVFAKANTHDVLEMHMYGDSQANFNLTTGVTTNNGASMSAVGDGWYFCKWTRTKSNTGGSMYLGISANTYAGVGVDKSLFIWHPQVERGNSYGRYIKTSGTSINAPTTVKNLSSSSITGTLNGPVFSGNSFGFDGSNDNISLPGPINAYPFTVCAWVTNDLGWDPSLGTMDEILNMSIAGQRVSCGIVNNTGWPGRLTLMYGGTSHWTAPKPPTTGPGDWHHIAWTVVGSNNPAHAIYLDGVSQTMTDNGGGHGGSAGWSIGSNNTNGEYWPGSIGEIQIYDRVLSAAEVLQNYNATSAKYGV